MSKLKFETGKEDDGQQARPGNVDDKGIVNKIDELLAEVLASNATHVHVEPGAEGTRVRSRVDSDLREVATFEAGLHPKIVNRFKILAGMDITRNKISQRGFFRVEADELRAECNAYVFPTVHGEKITVDILYKQGVTLSLEHLGFFTEVLKSYKEALAAPNGLVLVAGPPGSGRTTTCYASLATMNSPQKALAAFEPVNKYELPGVVLAAPSGGLSFAEGVRAMMESNPDVCLVGEVQDPEVARLMLAGAFAKRLVLGRMVAAHDSIQALVTLLDMGIQPFLLTAAVNAVLAQRLVRRICDGCKTPYSPPEQLVAEIGYKMKPDIQFYRGAGCAACGGTGFRGQIALFELLILNDQVSEMLVARRTLPEIREQAAKSGMVSLKRDGVNKVVMGYTAVEEVLSCL
ncbi:MAG: ATPase, T2SS/T4P/T4SS family [Acidobacteriota bacterium]